MAIQYASEHTPATPTKYCSASDVRVYLSGLAMDDERNAFAAVWNSAEFENMAEKYLALAKLDIDRAVGHDFANHEDIEIAVDGSSTDTINLASHGFVPLTSISALTIDDYDETVSDFRYDIEGAIALDRKTDDAATAIRSREAFPGGIQNIELTITWGYASVPADIEAASAYQVGLYLIPLLSVVQAADSPVITGGWQSVTIDNLRVTTGVGGRYSVLQRFLQGKVDEITGYYRRMVIAGVAPGDWVPRMKRWSHYFPA